MGRRSIRGHALVVLATGAGIAGMGTVFSGIMHGNVHTVMQGAGPLLLGLWWAGRELDASMRAGRERLQRHGGGPLGSSAVHIDMPAKAGKPKPTS